MDGDISYDYNGDGLQVSKTVGGSTTPFVWNEAEALPELLEAGETSYLYGPEGQPIEEITGGTATFLHQDQQGSVRLLTDASGNVVGRYDYTAWGAVAKRSGSATSRLQFDGQYTDEETGFQYLRARYYDPGTGQFLSVDPWFPLTEARFSFGADNPVAYGDSSGLHIGDPFGAIQTAWDTINAGASVVTVPIVCALGGKCKAATHQAGSDLKKAGSDYLQNLFHLPSIFIPSSIHLPGVSGPSGPMADETITPSVYAPTAFLDCDLSPLPYLSLR